MDDRTFIDQRPQRGPGRRVQHEDGFESVVADVPRLAIAEVPDQPAPKSVEPQLDVTVSASESAENVDQSFRGKHADIAMEDRPADLKGRDQIALGPLRWPVLQAKVTDGAGAIRRLGEVGRGPSRPPHMRNTPLPGVRVTQSLYAASASSSLNRCVSSYLSGSLRSAMTRAHSSWPIAEKVHEA